MNRLLPAAFLLLSNTLAVAQVGAQDMPPARYESWGVCPFECCTYREWTADDDVAVHQRRSEQSAIVFRVRRGEAVDGVTGVVVTEKPAAVLIDRAVDDGYITGNEKPQLALKAGDVVYMLSPLGEGSFLFWYKGKVYQSGRELAAMPGVDAGSAKMTWWKQVRNKSGKLGWTTSSKFQNVDACG